MLLRHINKTTDRPEGQAAEPPASQATRFFQTQRALKSDQPSLIHFSSMPLFRLEKDHETFAHILKKKDVENVGPVVNYFIRQPGHSAYLGGDAVRNLYLLGKRKKYKVLNMLAILTASEVDTCEAVMNNIISSNDGAFSLGFKFTVRKNRCDGCFRDVALARYVIEPRLEGPEKLLYPFRSSPIEVDLTTHQRFIQVFGVEPH
jgi:hypothetical protein